MKVQVTARNKSIGFGLGLTLWAALLLSGCGGGGGGDSGGAQSSPTAQTISFSTTPALSLHGTATVSATTSSGLPVTYTSTTPTVCSVDGSTGVVTALTTGTCTIAASQAGNSQYAAATQVTQNVVVSGGTLQQTITFATAPMLSLRGKATVSATATSGLPVAYSSTTPTICSVDGNTGVVTDIVTGTCTIAADQAGNADYAPAPQVTQSIVVTVTRNQTISFGIAPAPTVGSTATVAATASSGLPVTYGSATPTICSVVGSTGVVTGIAVGSCTITANQSGNADYDAAPQATLTLTIAAAPVQSTVPGIPAGVKAALGSAANTVTITIGATDSGGSAITGYAVTSSPAGLTGTGTASPITVSCPTTCNGYAFSAYAVNAVGAGAPSMPVDVITTYGVVETFAEPATQPNNTIFTGSFTFDSTTGTVSSLAGSLTESMTGGCATISGCPGSYGHVPMTLVSLTNQLSAVPVTLGGVNGLLVTTFALSTTNTFYNGIGNGWSPQSGVDVGGVYYGWPAATNPFSGGVGNAYAMIFVNTTNPSVPLTQAQIDKLAYADCTAGGMMGAVCMTGTTVAGYGAVGTMGGYPVSQVVTKQ